MLHILYHATRALMVLVSSCPVCSVCSGAVSNKHGDVGQLTAQQGGEATVHGASAGGQSAGHVHLDRWHGGGTALQDQDAQLRAEEHRR